MTDSCASRGCNCSNAQLIRKREARIERLEKDLKDAYRANLKLMGALPASEVFDMIDANRKLKDELASLRDQLAEYETFTKEIAKDLREKWCVPGRKEMWGFLRWLETFCMTKFPDLYPHLNPPPADKGEK